MDNRRRHLRHPVTVHVKITHPAIGEKIVETKNISDSGLFLLVDPTEMPSLGEIVLGQVQGEVDDLPVVKMKIVRMDEKGLGLQFIDE